MATDMRLHSAFLGAVSGSGEADSVNSRACPVQDESEQKLSNCQGTCQHPLLLMQLLLKCGSSIFAFKTSLFIPQYSHVQRFLLQMR